MWRCGSWEGRRRGSHSGSYHQLGDTGASGPPHRHFGAPPQHLCERDGPIRSRAPRMPASNFWRGYPRLFISLPPCSFHILSCLYLLFPFLSLPVCSLSLFPRCIYFLQPFFLLCNAGSALVNVRLCFGDFFQSLDALSSETNRIAVPAFDIAFISFSDLT